ncbi:unnamed protein product [Cylicocyclus nassatus]|uniref:Uncharacterized protein n=1 Tax=Cylicocyclus nassatus TaxID=53992 RepID=A0AA36DS43_CYLNA|nr:unnamed protein product [Cylicocyclus nassatus]
MTKRAVELLQNHKVREGRKRNVGIDGETNERWCFCKEGSSGSMICCDASDIDGATLIMSMKLELRDPPLPNA